MILGATVVAALLAAASSGYRFWPPDVPAEVLLAQAREALAAKDYATAEDSCLRLLGRHGRSVPALLLAAEAAVKRGRPAEALGYYGQLPTDAGDKQAAVGHAAAGDLLLQMYHASAAEAQFRRALAVDPQLLVGHERLGYLLGIEGRRWESLPHLFALLRADFISTEVLILLGNHAAAIDQTEELRKFRKAAPDDVLPLLGEARLAIRRTRMDEAKRLLKQVLAKAPNQIEAQAELGALLLSEADPELSLWLVEAAPAAEAHPDVWMTRGLWAKQRGDTRGAARCFWEAIERDPSHQAATYQLAQALESLDDSATARRLSDRAARLQQLCGVMDKLYFNRGNLGLLRSAAELTESLGCVWEACGWHRVILSVDPQASASEEAFRRLQALLRAGAPLVLDSANPARQIDLSHFPLPRWDAEIPASKPATPELAKYRARFADAAASAGIDFRYFGGQINDDGSRRMFQFTGGGVAVLDYDADGWPDLYLAQGCRWPPATGQTEHLDRLYRNRGDGTFEDVTAESRLAEDRFGQGVAAGDFNDDGFPDLYVANIGVNRLYMNQGDGTFEDVTQAAGIEGEAWTSSCLLADLNGDGLPDIYDVNYVQAVDVYERICSQNGKPRACAPTVFEPLPDRFYLNLGDGRFAERTEAAGMKVGGGNGLGIVAGDLDGSGRLGLFVANDQDANFFWSNETAELGAAPQFVERGVLSGLAYDADGKALACMGIAAGDADGDGRLDLFVTNYYEESNTLYLQGSSGTFIDATTASGLRAPSYRMLGFGTQFIDGELDGYPDLIVTNGHVEDLSERQVPYKMPPQYFRGLGGGKFAELPAAELGEFFEGKYLGRGLARLDWNRDGREDFVISHLDAPTALVANVSPETGHYLAVQLRGVRSSRDAIGAEVAIEAAGRRRTQWLTAGDGYQASNQRQLAFGLGAEERVQKLHVRWPSGLRQEFNDLAADQVLILVEGSPRVTRLP
ncbi:MAG TPA: FG-GAP-like repeat-containing protein [Pirellulales bacterium]|nr:FG-GAP-like repeat-containing protein [Pirellulales bacterium]